MKGFDFPGFASFRSVILWLSAVSPAAMTLAQNNTADPLRTSQEQLFQTERETQLRQELLNKQLQASPDVTLQVPSTGQSGQKLPKDEQPCFQINTVVIQGANAPAFAHLNLQLDLQGERGDDSPAGQCLGTKGVSLLMKRVQDRLVAEGFVTTRVLAPPQDLSTGELKLEVLPGTVQKIHLPAGKSKAKLWNALPIRTGDVLQLRDIEQGLENLKRVPTAEADIQIKPASQPGQSDLMVSWQQEKWWRLSMTADDSGGKSSGKYQGSVTLSADHAMRLNDLLYVTASRDLGGGEAGHRGTRGLNAHYSLPMGYWLISANGGQNRYFQTVVGSTQDYVYSGDSSQQDVKIARLFYRNSVSKASVSIRPFARQSENYIDDTEVQVQRRRVGGYEVGLNHKTKFGPAQIDSNWFYKRGTGAFGANVAPEEQFGEGTHRFQLVHFDVQMQAPFQFEARKWQYLGHWRQQSHRSTLTPQDRFSIGGRHTVRGFDGSNSLAAESGWIFRNELSTALGQGAHQLFFSLDKGVVSGPRAEVLLGRSLTGMSLGFRGKLKDIQYEIFSGRPISKPVGFQTAKNTFGFSLSTQF